MIIRLDSGVREALELLESWEKSGKIPSSEELAKIDPQAAQVMRSKIFQDGKLYGREPIDNLVGLVFRISEAITLDRENKQPGKWREQVDQEFDALSPHLKRAAMTYLFSQGFRYDKKRQPKTPLKRVDKLYSEIREMYAATVASPPQPKGDLAHRVSEILKDSCPGAKSYTLGLAIKELLEELEVYYIASDKVRKSLDRKSKSKAR